MHVVFPSQEIPVVKVKNKGTIKAAVDKYRSRQTPMKQLLTDYLAVKSYGDRLAEAENPRAYYYKGIEAASADADRIAFIASGSSSSLPPLMSELDEAGAQLIAIHDRPLKTVLGEYSYLIECSGLSYEDYVRISESTDLSLRFLGCFRSESS